MSNERYIFALGFFDGVHLGHQALLACCRELAREQGALSAAITFDGHPQSLSGRPVPPLLNSTRDRLALLRGYGAVHTLVLPVTPRVMGTPWEAFLERLLEEGAVGFVCGHDFRFGAGGQGNTERLAEFCRRRQLPLRVVPEQTLEGVRISSTHIRALLERGDTETALRFLGHPHLLTGNVEPGQQLGRTLGVPTANLRFPREVLVPRLGVYACRVRVEDRCYLAVANVGTRPTVAGSHVTVEPWLLDFRGDLYGREIAVEFHSFLRPEEKFGSLEALRGQIRLDARAATAYFAEKQE